MDRASIEILRLLAARPRRIGYVLAPVDIRAALTPDEYDLYSAGLLRVEVAPDGRGHVLCVSAAGRDELEKLAVETEKNRPSWLRRNRDSIVIGLLTSTAVAVLFKLLEQYVFGGK